LSAEEQKHPANGPYDLAVLGGGPGGYIAALRAAARGARVCCIESGQIGGTCLNVGCIPTKALLHAAELYGNMARANKFGLTAENIGVDGPAMMQWLSKTVAALRKGVLQLLSARKVDVIRGRGRLAGRDELTVETKDGAVTVQAGSIIIATGSRPVRPSGFPWDSGRLWTTDEATTVDPLPDSVLVVGGGVIGCEFATIYSELGIPTTLVEMLDYLVMQLDGEASRIITRSLKRRRAKVLTGSRITGLQATSDGVTATLAGGKTLQADRVLVAVGRQANIEDIGLEDVGVRTEDGIIPVDARCRTNVEGIYAVGDVAEKLQYAHLAGRMGAVAADQALGIDSQDDRTVVPVGVYTHPEVAQVGMTEEQARQAHQSIKTSTSALRASGLAQVHAEVDGSVKLVADADSGQLLGVLAIGPRATDVVAEAALAVRNHLTVEQVAATIHAHPTFSEAIGEAAESWLGLPVHSLR